jgi:hypothetical protein
MNTESVLKAHLPADLVHELLRAYQEIENNYVLEKWKSSELDAGHFVEAARRIVEHTLFGKYTPLDRQLPQFNDTALRQYEQATGDESYRILIPRVLHGVYAIRNKRGVGHVGQVSPNKMDASLILHSAKWVLAELLRLSSGLSPDQTQRIVDAIVERKLDALWKHGEITKVLDTSFTARQEILILLYDASPQKAAQLRDAVEYANSTNFRNILKRLHNDKLIYYAAANEQCTIMPPGVREAEALLLKRRP